MTKQKRKKSLDGEAVREVPSDLRKLITDQYQRHERMVEDARSAIEDTEKLIEYGPRRRPRSFRL